MSASLEREMRKLEKTFHDFGEKKTGQIVNYIYTWSKSIINLVGSFFVNHQIYPQKRMERIKTLSYPSHILQAQGDGIVSVLLLTVVTNGGVENPFIIQILHQST